VVRPGRRKKRKTPLLWIAGGAAVLLAGLLILKPWKKNPDSRNGPPATDFQTVAPRDTVVEDRRTPSPCRTPSRLTPSRIPPSSG
jgi:hypothetical protein